MSSVAFPLPKPAGGRPPFGGPPTRTSYDAQPEDEGEPIHRRIEETVRALLKFAKRAETESDISLGLRLIEQRKRVVYQELSALRMMMPAALPPLLTNLYSLEYLFEDDEVERLYMRLLDELDLEAERLRKNIREQSE